MERAGNYLSESDIRRQSGLFEDSSDNIYTTPKAKRRVPSPHSLHAYDIPGGYGLYARMSYKSPDSGIENTPDPEYHKEFKPSEIK